MAKGSISALLLYLKTVASPLASVNMIYLAVCKEISQVGGEAGRDTSPDWPIYHSSSDWAIYHLSRTWRIYHS